MFYRDRKDKFGYKVFGKYPSEAHFKVEVAPYAQSSYTSFEYVFEVIYTCHRIDEFIFFPYSPETGDLYDSYII